MKPRPRWGPHQATSLTGYHAASGYPRPLSCSPFSPSPMPCIPHASPHGRSGLLPHPVPAPLLPSSCRTVARSAMAAVPCPGPTLLHHRAPRHCPMPCLPPPSRVCVSARPMTMSGLCLLGARVATPSRTTVLAALVHSLHHRRAFLGPTTLLLLPSTDGSTQRSALRR